MAVINRVRPRFAVVCGDLTNMIPEIYPHLPEEIRGYGHVKHRHLEAARGKWAQLMAQWRAAAPQGS